MVATVALHFLSIAPALAARYYVSPSGSDSNNGTTSTSAWRTIGKANNTLRAGDMVVVLPGTYSESIDPANSGSPGFLITYVGSLADPASIQVNNIQLSGNDFISVKGVTAAGRLDINASGSNSADYDSVSYCVVRGAMASSGAWNCVVSKNSIGTPGTTSSTWALATSGGSITAYSTFEDNVIHTGVVTGGRALFFFQAQNNVIRRNNITMTTAAGATDSHGLMIYHCRNNSFSDNKWTMLNLSSYDSYMLNCRDSTSFNTFERDSFVANPASTGGCKALFSTSGTYPGTQKYNTWRSCFMRVTGPFGFQDTGDGCTFVDNVFISNWDFWPRGDSLTFDHNTFYSVNRIVVSAENPSWLSHTRWTSNIFYAEDGGGTHTYIRDDNPRLINNNLYYSPSSTSGNATHLGGVGSSSSGCTGSNRDCSSRWGNPGFQSVTSGSWDLSTTIGSIARTVGFWPDGYVGARRFAGPPLADGVPPAAINDLQSN